MIKTVICVVWLGTTGWLIRYEVAPHWFDGTVQGYRGLSEDLPAMRDSWMRVMADGEHVGYLNSANSLEETEGHEEWVLSTQMALRLRMGGAVELLRVGNRVRLNARHELVHSESTFSLGDLEGDLRLTPRGERGEYRLEIHFNGLSLSRAVSIPANAVVSSPLLDSGIRRVKPGQVIRIRAVDPFSMSGSLQTVEVRGLSMKTKTVPGESRPLDVTRLETRIGDLAMLSEVDPFGRVLWQQTPFGLTFVFSRPQAAIKIPDGNAFDPAALLSSPLFSTFLSPPPFP